MPFEGILYERNPDSSTSCRLCAHYCIIKTGKRGICRVRENRAGTLYSLVYGKLVARNADPIEKKPLYHFEPGTLSYSIATAGCNMSCSHCQNYQISMLASRTDPIPGHESTPNEVVSDAIRTGCSSISYTYTEPTVFMEFARDCAAQASRAGLSNVFVTNGYMSEESAVLAGEFLEAANVDLKAATEEHWDGRFAKVLWQDFAAFRLLGAIRDDGENWYLTRKGMYYWVLMMREFFIAVSNFRDLMRLGISSELDPEDHDEITGAA